MDTTPEQMLARFRDMNPFATRWIRPGAIPYRFTNGDSIGAVIQRLESTDWRGEIVGPHGSGKSSLVAALIPALEEVGRKVTRYSLKAGERKLTKVSRSDMKSWNADTQVIVDGYEQLGNWSKQLLKQICRQRGAGLLVTTHSGGEFPLLFETSISRELVEQLVVDLQPETSRLVKPADVAESFQRNGQNLREVLFEMYDLYEIRRASGEAVT